MGARFIWLGAVAIAGVVVPAIGAMLVAGAGVIAWIQALNPWIRAAILMLTAYARNWLHFRDIVNGVITGFVQGLGDAAFGVAWLVEQLAHVANKIPGAKNIIGDQTGLAEGIRADFAKSVQAIQQGQDNLAATLDNFKIPEINLKGWLPDFSKALQQANAAQQAAAGGMPHIDTSGGKGKPDKALVDQLNDSAKGWEMYADAVEKSAQRQVDAMQGVQDKLRDFFGDVQNRLLELGVLNNPLKGLIDTFDSLMGIPGKARGILSNAADMRDFAQRQAAGLRSRVETLHLAGRILRHV
jgi:hypothetical protein